MGWYDLFSRFYDTSLERYYVEQRTAAVDAMRLRPDHTVLDLPCGTGQSFDGIAPAIGTGGTLVGVDLSTGMLSKARERAQARGWTHVHLRHADVHDLDADMLAEAVGRPVAIDRLHVFLGLTAFPRWEQAFERLWDLLAPGGRCVVVDVHAEKLGFQGRMVNLVARADIRRRFWEPLERVSESFARAELPSLPEHGGQIYLATGDKPA